MPENNEHRIDYHRRHPHVLLSKYTLQKRFELGLELENVQKIYLDQRFWILFRDASLNPSHDQSLSTLLALIKSLVSQGRAICPISESVFFELLKQSDETSRLATAKLIDELSKGVTLITFDQRVTEELRNSLYRQAGIPDLIPVQQLVWTKLAYILDEIHLTNMPFPPDESLAIQKAFFDHMWETPLTEMIRLIGNPQETDAKWDELAIDLNTKNQKHFADLKSYKQTFRIEFIGGLSNFRDEIVKFSDEIDKRGFKKFGAAMNHLSQNKRFEAFTLEIPTLHVYASCHAAVGWDRQRNLKGNDFFDFQHAQAAVSYCDLFLTEKSLSILLNQSNLGLIENYRCKTFWSPETALTWLQDNLKPTD